MIPHPRTILRLALLLALACCSGFLTDTVRAQEETAATINGQVTDSTGAIVTGATVVATNTSTNAERQVQTNDDGLFVITALTPGTYTVVVEQPNFKRYEATNVVLNARDRRPVNVVLEAGNVSEVVTVTSEQTSVQDGSTTQTLISGTQVVELPLVNRDFTKLTELVPGVSSSLTDETDLGLTNRFDISINGLRRNSINVFVDGVSNTDVGSNITLLSTPTIDSIQEFKVLSSNYTAEVGRSGGGTITIVTKGGGNAFHGSLYEFIRNDRFNANSFLNNTRGLRADGTPAAPVPKLRYNNFGGTISGPVYLPRFGEGGPAFYSGKDKTFFFFSEEVRRINRGITSDPAFVLTDAQRGGNFSASLNASLPIFRASNGTASCTSATTLPTGVTCTTTPLLVTTTDGNMIQAVTGQIFRADGRAYTGNIIPRSDFDPLASSLLSVLPSPNLSGNRFIFTPANFRNTRQETIRVDHNFNDNYRLFGRYTHDLNETEESGGLFNSLRLPNIATTETLVPGQTFVASLTGVLSPTVVNEITYNYSSNNIGSTLTGLGRRSDYPGSSGIGEIFSENAANLIPTVTITGLSNGPATFNAGQEFSIAYKNQVVRDVLTATVGNHILKFGGEVSFERKNENLGASATTQGSFSFTGAQTRGTSGGINLTQTGVAPADFLLGRAFSYSETERDPTVNLSFGRREFFAQDTWKIRPNITLDYGVRYQYFAPVVDDDDRLASFDPFLYSAANAPVCANANCSAFIRNDARESNGIGVVGSTGRFGNSIIPKDKNNFSPRVGIAYSPNFGSGLGRFLFGGEGKSVIRAGYGFYYDQVLVGIFENAALFTLPFNRVESFTSTSAGTVTFANPRGGASPTTFGARTLIQAISPDFKTPEIQQYSLGFQRELFRNAVIDVAYVGTKGDFLIRPININLPQPADVLRVGRDAANSVRPYLGYGNITYLETSAVSRYNGLLSSFAYRFTSGSSITAAYTFSKTLTDSTNDRDGIDIPQNPLDKRAEYAEARTSRPHIFSASYVYEIPFFTRSSNALLRTVLGGFQISGITQLESGPPIARVTLSDTLGGLRGLYPNLVSDPAGGLAGTTNPATGFPYVFDPNAFANPAQGTFGNAPRAFIRAPGRNQTNLSLAKNIYFTSERGARLQLRAEGFNIFNHTQFLSVNTTLGATAPLGQVTGSTRLPREFQFGAKLSF